MNIKQPAFGDGSHWEIVNWDNFDSRILAVIWKITQGKFYIDPTCASFWVGAGKLKLPRSVFHFFEPNDISAQVENYLTACEDHGIIVSGKWMAEIEPVLDAEYSPPTATSLLLGMVGIETSRLPQKKLMDFKYPEKYLSTNKHILRTAQKTMLSASVTGAQLAAQYKAWLDGVESEVGIKPIIYTSKWFWMHTGFPEWESQYKLWDAQYPYSPDEQNAPLYFPYGHFKSWWSWQYSASAVLEGVTGFMDVNVFNGTIEQWQEQYGGGAIPPIDPPGEPNMTISIGTVLAYRLNVRSTPDSSNAANLIGPSFLHSSDLVQFDRVENSFAHVAHARRNGVDLTMPGADCWAFIGDNFGYIRPEWSIDVAPDGTPDAEVRQDLGMVVDGVAYVPDHLDGSTVVYKRLE